MAEATANGMGQPALHAGHAHDAAATGAAHAEVHQEHPIKLYLVVWAWLFILSTCSYLVDYFGLHGYLRWSLILIFMILKAGLIVAVFMHMAWERLALAYAIILPPTGKRRGRFPAADVAGRPGVPVRGQRRKTSSGSKACNRPRRASSPRTPAPVSAAG